jgi:hypothetical protein
MPRVACSTSIASFTTERRDVSAQGAVDAHLWRARHAPSLVVRTNAQSWVRDAHEPAPSTVPLADKNIPLSMIVQQVLEQHSGPDCQDSPRSKT